MNCKRKRPTEFEPKKRLKMETTQRPRRTSTTNRRDITEKKIPRTRDRLRGWVSWSFCLLIVSGSVHDV
ncbi:hypothetical protein A4A49_06376 [Nicotiana attenuata]|uniref:Uncharacterized protein n=1 Tax=Nicotiana attenuata TaxID=49451 RepID=A0A314L5D8_NICAT|nr:hypothetical protein A4A49_06376 [Nicotiana attenuata]